MKIIGIGSILFLLYYLSKKTGSNTFSNPLVNAPVISNPTGLLYHFDKNLLDSSPNALNLIATGSLAYPSGKFAQGLSGFSSLNSATATYGSTQYSAMVGDYILGDLTVEFFAKFVTGGNTQTIMKEIIYTGSINLSFELSSNNTIGIGLNGEDFLYYNIASMFNDGLFHHVALVLSGGTGVDVYLDGVNIYHSTTRRGPLLNPTGNHYLNIGGGGGMLVNHIMYPFAGVIDEFRISKEAVYTANFIPPNDPFSGVLL